MRAFARSAPKAATGEDSSPASSAAGENATVDQLGQRTWGPKERKMRTKMLRRSFSVSKKITFSEMLLKTSVEDLSKRRTYLRKEYGFTA